VVGFGWAHNSVNTVILRKYAVTTIKDYQFTAYYDDKSNLILGKRKLKSDQWEIHLTRYKGNISDTWYRFFTREWGHHDTQLRYAISSNPLTLKLREEQYFPDNSEIDVPLAYGD